MSLREPLDAFKSEFARPALTGCPALYDVRVEELRASVATKEAVLIGNDAAHVSLLNGLVARARIEGRDRRRLEPDAVVTALKSLRLV